MIEIRKLSNGTTLVLEPMTGIQSVSVGIWLPFGSAGETAENNGITHMIEHMVFKGTPTRDARAIADVTAKLGSNMNAYTGKECTAFYCTTLTEYLPEACGMLGDMLGSSLFAEADFEREKEVICEEIDMYDDSPDDMVHEKLQQAVWKDHPLGFIISGRKEIVRGFRRDQVKTFWQMHYTGSNLVISAAGAFDPDAFEALADRCFGGFPTGTPAIDAPAPVYRKTMYSQSKDVEQVHMNLAFDSLPETDEARYAISIVHSILGGNDNSRLIQTLREDMGLCYSIYSYDSSFRQAGLFQIDAALHPAKLPEALKAVRRILEECRRDGFTASEVHDAAEQSITEMILGAESSRSRMTRNGRSWQNFGRVIPQEETEQKLRAVTVDQVNAYVRRFLDWDTRSISLVGNIEEIDPALTNALEKEYNTKLVQ